MSLFTRVLFVVFCFTVYCGAGERIRYIYAFGYAEQFVAPDSAEVNFTVEVRDKKLSRAQELHAKNVVSVEFALKEAGFDKEQIFTTHRRVVPVLKKNKVDDAGFVISQSYVVRLSDVTKVQAVLHSLHSANVSHVEGVSYSTTKAHEIELEVLSAATQDAMDKAQAVAKPFAGKLGGVLMVEQQTYPIFKQPRAVDDDGFSDFDDFGDSFGSSPKSEVTEGLLEFSVRVQLQIALQ